MYVVVPTRFAAYYAINGLMWWLFGMPCLYVGWNMLVFRCRRKRAALWKDVLTNLAIMLPAAKMLRSLFVQRQACCWTSILPFGLWAPEKLGVETRFPNVASTKKVQLM